MTCCDILAPMDKDWLGPRGAGEGAERPEARWAFGDCLGMAFGMTLRLVCQVRRRFAHDRDGVAHEADFLVVQDVDSGVGARLGLARLICIA